MRAPLSWLRELTPLAADARDRSSIDDLASELNGLGLVVEGIHFVGDGLDDVVLARVLEIAAIKGADRIRRVVVDAGGGDGIEVVCGAWNFAVGDVVPLARVGSVLPNDFRIERRKLKGVVSNGMLCSGRELELSDDHEGILVLGRPGEEEAGLAGIELGAPLSSYLGFGKDAVFDLDVEPNRPDCLSMLGIARDLSARYGLPLQVPEPIVEGAGAATSELVSVEIDDATLCRRFVARVVSGVQPVESQPLVKRRLVLCGMRPIDHVVDASNYVMLELGQPTHPYDLDLLDGAGFRVRAARPGETIVTLDGESRILDGRQARRGDPSTTRDALICDESDVPIGVAGVMGGRSSEISESTTRVVLEAADFDGVSVARTARHLGVRTEASVRFERGIDPEGLERAAARVVELIAAAAVAAGVTPPVIARGIADKKARPFSRRVVVARPERVNALLGLELSRGEMLELLAPIGYSRVEPAGAGRADSEADPLELVVPSWRPDVEAEVDIVEEVARTYGYGKIPARARRSPYVGTLSETQSLRRQLRGLLAGLGAHEAWTSSIVDPREQRLAGAPVPLVTLSNPLAAEQSALRGGLLAGLLGALRHNASHRNPWLRLFEIGDVFSGAETEGSDGAAVERERVALVLGWESDDARAAVRAWRVVEDSLRIVGVELREAPSGEAAGGDGPAVGGLHPARASVLVGSTPSASGPSDRSSILGVLGEVDPAVLADFDLPHERVGWLELDVAALVDASRRPLAASVVSKYPSSDIDLAFVLDDAVSAGRVEETLREAAGELCECCELFDVYRGEGIADGSRSLAFHIRLCAPDRTLTDEEVADPRRRCIKAVEVAFGATLRGGES